MSITYALNLDFDSIHYRKLKSINPNYSNQHITALLYKKAQTLQTSNHTHVGHLRTSYLLAFYNFVFTSIF